MNNRTKIKDINVDARRFLTDGEFENFKGKVEFAFHEAARLIPDFNAETQAMSNEQANSLLPFAFKFEPLIVKK